MIKTLYELNQEFLQEFVPTEAAIADTWDAAPDANDVLHAITAETEKKQSVAKVREKQNVQTPVWKDLLFLLIKIVVILLAFIAVFTFIFGFIRYGEPSMYPAIKDGDLVIYHRYTKVGYLAQDTIVLKHDGQIQARRVVAIAGDTVDITENGLIVNGAVQQETDIFQRTERYAEGISFPLTVPEGKVFVLGDSRVGATDSRIYGPIEIDDTFGKVMAVIRRRSI